MKQSKSENGTDNVLEFSEKAREAYRQSDSFSRTVIESSRDCIKTLSLSGELLWISDTGQKMLCIPDLAAVLGKSWIDFWDGRDREAARHAVSEGAQGRSSVFIGHYRVCEASRWWEVIVSPILNSNGVPEQLLAVSRDVTGRMETRQNLEEALARVTEQVRMLDLSADAIISSRIDGTILFWNVGAEKMYGWTREEVLGKDGHQLLKTVFPEPLSRITETLIRAGKWRGELVHTRKDGTTLTVLCRKALARDAQGQPSSVLVSNTDITAQKQTREALKHREHQLRSFVEATSNVIWRTNAVGEVDEPVPSWNAFTGQSDSEAAGFGWLNAIHRQDLPRVRAAWKRASVEKKICEVEYRLKTRTGEWRHVIARGVPVFGPNGEVREYIGSCNDITDQRLAEKRLRESEARLATVVDNLAEGLILATDSGDVFYWNKAGREIHGMGAEESLSFAQYKAVFEVRTLDGQLITPDEWPLKRLLRDGSISRFEVRVSRKGESWEKVLSYSGRFLQTITGQRVAALSFLDVTELRRAEAELREREAVLRTVANEARVGLAMVDKDRRYMFANRTYIDMQGLAEPNVIGKRVPDVLGPVYEQIAPHLDRAFAGERLSFELQVPGPGGAENERVLEIVFEPRLADPANPYVVVVVFDITEQKQTRQSLEKVVADRTSELRETNEQLESLVYSIAHDLRGPLRAMQGYSELVLDESADLPVRSRNYLDRINNSARAMDRMILDLLAFGRIARTDMELAPVSVENVWEAVLRQTRGEIEQNGAKIELASPLPVVRAHAVTLAQVLANLLSNAIKFVEAGTTPHVRFWSDDMGGYIRLWMEDNGIGIDPKYHERIFRVFERLEGSKYPGTGIGLAIVRKGVERMNGRLGMESAIGRGTRFWVELPKP